MSLQWRHNELDSVSNNQHHDCFLNRLCRQKSKKTSKLRVTGLCARNSPEAGEFPAQMASNAENVSIWWRHHVRHILSIFTKLMTWGSLAQWHRLSQLLRIIATILLFRCAQSTFLTKNVGTMISNSFFNSLLITTVHNCTIYLFARATRKVSQ